MKALILSGLFALAISGCAKAVAEEKGHEHKCHCEVKVSAPSWVYGTLCPEGSLSRGHGKNKNGQVVSACHKIEHSCHCDVEK